jgi:hypothetical protein
VGEPLLTGSELVKAKIVVTPPFTEVMEVMVTDAAPEASKLAAAAMLTRILAKRFTIKGALLMTAAVTGTLAPVTGSAGERSMRGKERLPVTVDVAGRGEDEGEGTVAATTAWGVSALVRESVLSYPSEVYRPVEAMF